MKSPASIALLLGVAASAEAFVAPTPEASSLTRVPSSCRRSTEVPLFRRRKNKEVDADLGSSSVENEVADEPNQSLNTNSRRYFLTATATSAALFPLRARASSDKQLNLSNDELKKIVLSDVLDKDFLVTADITRSIYDESATFTDEIDVYTMDKWVKGTKALFIPSRSTLNLVGDVDVTSSAVTFRFDEDLCFNIPFKPVCSLTGKVVLTRDQDTGLITSYREFWDQSVNDVLKTAKFGKKA